MFHLITGTVTLYGSEIYITNDLFGIQVSYKGQKEKGTFFLHPIIDDHSKSIKYFAFDESSQKETFLNLLKIQGIGPKVAFEIAHIDGSKIAHAVESFDVAFFQTIPGIGPKTAKKILVELKSSFSSKDIIKINADDKLVKNITKTLTAMGYDKTKVLTKLAQYEEEINEENLSIILQWMIKGL